LRQAGSCHQQALGLARQIGSAWDEAHALAGLGRCALAAGHAATAEGMLRQALEIFQRIGVAEAAGVFPSNSKLSPMHDGPRQDHNVRRRRRPDPGGPPRRSRQPAPVS
jgi:hypothetical protein